MHGARAEGRFAIRLQAIYGGLGNNISIINVLVLYGLRGNAVG